MAEDCRARARALRETVVVSRGTRTPCMPAPLGLIEIDRAQRKSLTATEKDILLSWLRWRVTRTLHNRRFHASVPFITPNFPV